MRSNHHSPAIEEYFSAFKVAIGAIVMFHPIGTPIAFVLLYSFTKELLESWMLSDCIKWAITTFAAWGGYRNVNHEGAAQLIILVTSSLLGLSGAVWVSWRKPSFYKVTPWATIVLAALPSALAFSLTHLDWIGACITQFAQLTRAFPVVSLLTYAAAWLLALLHSSRRWTWVSPCFWLWIAYIFVGCSHIVSSLPARGAGH